MNYHARGLQISFAVHALLYLIIAGIGGSFATPAKTITIDFSIENAQPAITENHPKPLPSTLISSDNTKPKRQTIPAKTPPVAEGTTGNPGAPQEVPSPPPEVATEKPALDNQQPQSPFPATPATPQAPTAEPQSPASASAAEVTAAIGNDPEKARNHVPPSKTPPPTEVTGSGSSTIRHEGETARYLEMHFSYIRDLIQRSLTYPRLAKSKGWEGKAMVSFTVLANGTIEDITLKESSGFGILDKNALETIKKVSPLPKPPAKAELIMPIVYRLE